MKRVLFIGLVAASLIGLAGCTGAGSFFSNPQNDLTAAEAGLSGVEALYTSVCAASNGAGICSPADQAEAAQLENSISQAIATAGTLVAVYNGAEQGQMPSAAQLGQAVQAVESAISNFSNFVNGLSAKKARMLRAQLKPGG